MKNGFTCVLSVFGVVLLFVPAWVSGDSSVSTSKRSGQAVVNDTVYISKRPGRLKKVVPAPRPVAVLRPMTAERKSAAINKVRQSMGLAPLENVAQPPKVTLTPDRPVQAGSEYSVFFGSNIPSGNAYTGNLPSVNAGYSMVGGGDVGSYLMFRLSTVPGKTYLLDMTLEASGSVTLQVAYEGTVTPQNGHVMVGFLATDAVSYLGVSGNALFYRLELTQVN